MRKITQTVIVANSQWLMDYGVDGFKPLDTTNDGQIVVYRTLKLNKLPIMINGMDHGNKYRLMDNVKGYPIRVEVGGDYDTTISENTFASQYFVAAILQSESLWKPVFWQRDSISGTWDEVLPHQLTDSNRILVIRWFISKNLYKQYAEYQQKAKVK